MGKEQELLDPKAFEVAESAYKSTATYHIVPANHDRALYAAITAYLAARRSSSDEAEVVADREVAQMPDTDELTPVVFRTAAEIECERLAGKSASPAGVKAGVTEEMVEAASKVFWDTSRDPEGSRDMRAALTAALGVGDEGIREDVPIKYVTLGRGEWVAGVYMRDEMPSLCLGPAPEPKAPGEKPTEAVSQWATRNGALVISFASIDAAVQMLDLVRDAIDLKAAPLPTPPIQGDAT